MQRPSTRYCLIFGVSFISLVCAITSARAQQYEPGPMGSSGFVNYQIMPLPPVTEVFTAEELLSAEGPELLVDPKLNADAGAEEVQPLEASEDSEKEASTAEDDPELVESELEILVEDESLWNLWRHWEVGYELGVNGSVGNSNTHTWRSALRAKRKTDYSVLTSVFDYKKSMQESNTIADRLFSDWRAEFPSLNHNWSLYIHGNLDFDAFRSYDARLTKDAGVGYQWYKTDIGSFITRAGAGASREFGGTSDEWVPEGVLGAVYERKLTKRQKLAFSSEFFFDWTNVGENRLNTKADWEVVLDEEAHLSLKVSIIDRYDSTPNGSKPNDLDYSTVLLWSF